MTHPVVYKVRPPLGDHPFFYQVAVIGSPSGSPMHVDFCVGEEFPITAAENHVQVPTNFAMNELKCQIAAAVGRLRIVLPVA